MILISVNWLKAFNNTIRLIKTVIRKTKVEISPVIVVDKLIELRPKSYCFSYSGKETAKQKVSQKTPQLAVYRTSLFNNRTTNSTNYFIRSNQHQIPGEQQGNFALNPSDDKRMSLIVIEQFSWDKHIRKGNCLFRLCNKIIGLYSKELTVGKTD